MTDDRRQAARRIFMEVADLTGTARDAAMAECCAHDASLRSDVEALLRANAQAGELESDPTSGAIGDGDATIAASPREQSGEMIGRYKLLERIGEGGFGSVWAAEQREPVKRRVALKIIKLGMDTNQVIARFEAERQALAMMDHPNIARVLDAGSTETGRPFFAMELVRGEPILDYCDTHKLDTKARLALFTHVCQAIQHAHQKGIIHRDIKPSNVLVTLHDGVPVPKVIDFGIAKATNQELTAKTVYTQHRQMIGTPAYMSPEQAEMSGLDIDTRADIYSLGVLLYELLTGTTPFAHDELMSKGYAEMMRIIREETPHKPSTRLATLGETGTRTAQQRHTDVKHLNLALRGDLDWIVMKCLEKDRTRRYETANGLATDVRRHLDDEPVLAGPPSMSYKLHKFVKRNRGKVIVGGVVVALLALGVLGTLTFAAREAHQRQLASIRESQARQIAGFQSSVLADANMDVMGRAILGAFREQIRIRLERQWGTDQDGVPRPRTDAEITELLATFDAIARPSDAAEIARDMIDTGLLVPAIESINNEFADQPLLQAELLMSIGITYDRIGRFHAAAAVDRRALELLRKHDAPSELISAGLYHLANDLMAQGRHAEAIPLVREELELDRALHGDTNVHVANAIDQLGVLLANTGDHAEAERLGREHLAMTIELEGEGGWPHIDSLWSLGYFAHLRDDLEEAESIYRQALAIAEQLGEGESRGALTLKHNIAEVMSDQARPAEAEELHREVLAARRAMLGHRHPGIAYSLDGLARALIAEGEPELAEPMALEALAIRRDSLSVEDPQLAASLKIMGEILVAKGDFVGAEPMYRELLTSARMRHGGEHTEVFAAMLDLAEIWILLDRARQGEDLLSTCDEAMQRTLAPDDWNLARSSSLRGWVLVRQLQFEEAEPLLISGYERISPREQADEKRKALQRIIDCYDAWHGNSPDGGYDAMADLWRSRQAEM